MIVRDGGRPKAWIEVGKEVTVDSYAGVFSLATPVEEHRAGALAQVTVSARHPSWLVLEFSDHHQVLADACVLLCGHIGALVLLQLGYTGPLARRPRLAAAHAPMIPTG